MGRFNSVRAAGSAAALAVALALGGCGGEAAENAETQAAVSASDARAVRVARVETRPVEGGLAVSGLLVAREEAAVGTEVVGYRVADVLADEGDWVRQGQVLAVIDPTLLRSDAATQRAAVQRAQAGLQQAQAAEAQARAEAARVAGLDGQGVLSQEAIEQRRSQANVARANTAAARAEVAAQQAQLNQINTRVSRTAVRAPVSGRVLERSVRPGDIAAGGQVMFRIAAAGAVEFDAEVPEGRLAGVRPGATAQVTLPSGGVVTGTVRYVDPTVDQQTRLGRARISLPPREDLRLGGFASAVIRDLAAPALSVPEAAVQFDADGAFVMAVGANNRVRRVNVRTGRRNNGFVELLQGPSEGTMVVLSGSAFLVEGDAVKPVLAAQAAARSPAAPAAGAVRGAAR